MHHTYASGHVVRVVCLSDTHWEHRSIRVTDGDILIHCGDFSTRGALLPPTNYSVVVVGLTRLCARSIRPAEPGGRVQRVAGRPAPPAQDRDRGQPRDGAGRAQTQPGRDQGPLHQRHLPAGRRDHRRRFVARRSIFVRVCASGRCAVCRVRRVPTDVCRVRVQGFVSMGRPGLRATSSSCFPP